MEDRATGNAHKRSTHGAQASPVCNLTCLAYRGAQCALRSVARPFNLALGEASKLISEELPEWIFYDPNGLVASCPLTGSACPSVSSNAPSS